MNQQSSISSLRPDHLLRNRTRLNATTLLRCAITVVWLIATFIANAAEPLTTTPAKFVADPSARAELQLLQGTWKGVMVGREKDGSVIITIIDNSLHFHRDTNFWFETTIALPAGKAPKQLHATIKRAALSQAESIGKVVKACFKIEDARLFLATIGDEAEDTTGIFETDGTRYELRKVQPQKPSAQAPEAKH